MIQVSTLVRWHKPITDPPNPDIRIYPAIVNQVWDEKSVSLFVFSFDGAFHARTVPMDQVEVVADPDQLISAIEEIGSAQRQMVELGKRIIALEELIAGPQPISQATSPKQVIPASEDSPAINKTSAGKLVAGKRGKE